MWLEVSEIYDGVGAWVPQALNTEGMVRDVLIKDIIKQRSFEMCSVEDVDSTPPGQYLQVI